MVSQQSLSLVYLRVSLNLLALTGCFILAPSQAQASDDTPLPDRSTDSSIPSQNADGENQELSTCSGKLRSPLTPLKKGGTEKALFLRFSVRNEEGTEKAPFLRGLGDLNCVSSNQNANPAPSIPQSHGNSDLTAKTQPLANPTPSVTQLHNELAVEADSIPPSTRLVENEIVKGASLLPLKTCRWELQSTSRQPRIGQHLDPLCFAENAELMADSNLGDRNFPLLAQTPVTPGQIRPPQTFHKADGVLTVQIVEVGLEAIEVRGTRRLNPNYIRSRIALAVSKPVNQRKLTEALLERSFPL